ncbi:AraC family transcriptional regulator [Burkholderia multivorans]|uniref:AraC family transcriptional regulator n=1 Tax=Burkholderia multivorans TaxID=87883 RepID=UPI001903A1AB|nr:AraC family transcriptional regulator [Burkholderia multivorans]MBJ9942880.1 AraC family transcriptional regulator [Burkholderia multivorans]MBU9286837.1 AraC family transcriptional regulator [Burkholderia multivorans]
MRPTVHRLPGRYYARLARIVAEHMRDPSEFIARCGFDPRTLHDPAATLTLAQLDRLIETASAVSGCAHLGLDAGRYARLTSHGPLGYALLSCSTLEELVRLAARYYHLIVPVVTMRYVRRGRFAEITYTLTVAMQARTLRFFVEALAVAFQVQIDGIVGAETDDYEIRLSTEAPADVHRYLGRRLARYRFGARSTPGVTVVIAASLLERPLPMANALSKRVAEAQCEARTRARADASDVVELIEMMLTQSADFRLSREEVAAAMNVTVRTLNRYLSSQGHTFRDVCQRTRFAHACRLLDEGRLTVTQIAAKVGFSDVANFSRGFREYIGVSPTRYTALSARASARDAA